VNPPPPSGGFFSKVNKIMGRLFGKIGFNVGFTGTQKAQPTPLEGYPLERHPAWRVLAGTYDTKLGWKDWGNIIYVKNQTLSAIKNLAFRNYFQREAYISAKYLFQPTSNEHWTLPFAKIVNGNNLVGARVDSNKVEVVQRKNGVWSTKASVANPINLGYWMVHITDNHISVFIDGNLVAEAAHSISGEAHWGISMHKYVIAADQDLLENYRVTSEEPLTLNGEQITHEGKNLYTMAELFEILAYEKALAADIEVTEVDPNWLPINQLVTQEKKIGEYEILFSLGWSYDVVNRSGKIRFSLDGGATWQERSEEPKDKTDRRTASIVLPLTLTADRVVDLRLEANKEGTGHVMTIHHSLISIKRVK